MVQISGSVPNLMNGVSRQPNSMRLPSQVEEMTNGLASPSHGNMKRGGSFHIAKTTDTFTGDIHIHPINRDTSERYHVVFENGDLSVYDIDGTKKTVTYPDGKTYLNTTTASSSIRAVTNADTTFIVNRETTPAMDAGTKSPDRGQECMFFVRSVNFRREYKLFLDGVCVAHFKTPDGDILAEERVVTPENVARCLIWGDEQVSDVNGWTGADGVDLSPINETIASVVIKRLVDEIAPADWEMVRYGSVIWLKRKDASDFVPTAEGGLGGAEGSTGFSSTASIVVLKDSIQDFTALPDRGPEGFVMRITGTPGDIYDNYWVKISKEGADDSVDEVSWIECPEPNTSIAFDATTMPHSLVRESGGDFTFRLTVWVDKKVGASADLPSFIGKKINNAFFFKGRLSLLAEEHLATSRAAEALDMWPSTVTAVLDDDPVDLYATEGPIAIYKESVEWDGNVFLTSEQAVHQIVGGDIFGPKTAALKLTLAHPVHTNLVPFPTQQSILFVSPPDANAASLVSSDVREMIPNTTLEPTTSTSITGHCEGYVPSALRFMRGSDPEGILVLGDDTVQNDLYVYQYLWEGRNKRQSAWHKWSLDADAEILDVSFFEDSLYLAIRRTGDNIWFEKIPLGSVLKDTGKDWLVRLDRRVPAADITAVYSAGNDETTLTLPWNPSASTKVTYGTATSSFGIEHDIVSFSGADIIIEGEFTVTTDLIVGNDFSYSFELSRLYMREGQRDGRQVPLESNRFQVARHWYRVQDSTEFTITVEAYPGATTFSKSYGTVAAGQALNPFGQVNLSNERISMPINGRGDRAKVTISNDTHYPSTILGYEWLGTYRNTARRV